MRHVTNEELLVYLATQEPETVGAHASVCVSCAKRMASLRAFTGALRAPDAWTRQEPATVPNQATEFAALADRLSQEERAAANRLAALDPAMIEIERSWCAIGAVRALHHAVIDERDKNPPAALVLAAFARVNDLPIFPRGDHVKIPPGSCRCRCFCCCLWHS